MPSLPGSRLPGTPVGGGGSLGNSRLPGTSLGSSSIGGGRLPGASVSSTLPEFAPGEHSAFNILLNKDRFIRDYVRALRGMGVSQDAAEAAAYTALQRKVQDVKRPSPFLSVVNRVLSAPGEATAGFVKGFFDPKSEGHPGSNNPWDIIRDIPGQAAAGYHEAGTALHQQKQLGDYMKEAHPTGPLSSGWAGFAASTIFDPVMYLSFGATAPAKMMARRALAESTTQAMVRAEKIISTKQGYFWGKKYTDPVELMQAIRKTEGMPMDLPQALDQLKGVGMDYKASMRGLHPFETAGEVTKPSLGRVVGAYALPTAVRGGRGIRFAGMEIPGTGDLTSGLARRLTGDISEKAASAEHPLIAGVVHGLMTNPELRLAGEDTIKSLALTEMATFKAETQRALVGAKRSAREIARGGAEKYVTPAERMGALAEEPPILSSADALSKLSRESDPLGFPKSMWAESTPEAIAKENWRQSAAVLWDPEKKKLIPAPPGNDHGDLIGAIAERDPQLNKLLEEGRLLEGTAIIDPATGKVAKVNLYPGEDLTTLKDLGRGAEEDLARVQYQAALDSGEKSLSRLVQTTELTPKQTIVRQIHLRVSQEVDAAKALKIPERQTRELWSAITAQTDDPVEAIGMFVFQNQVRVRSRQFVQRLLNNPLYAKKVHVGDVMPPGYKPHYDEITRQHYAVLGEMANVLEDMVNPQFLDRSTNAIMKALSMPQNYWKQFATSANPSFHVMNFLGAMWNNLYAGIYNPADYVRALATLYNARMEEAVQSGAERYIGRHAVSTPRTQKAAQLFEEARVRGATSETASIFAEIQEGLQRGPQSFVPTAPPSVQARMADIIKRRPKESRARYALRQSRRGTAVGMLATGNPIGIALLAPEAAHIGRVLGTTIEDVVRLAPFMKASKDPVLLRYLDAFGPIRVPGMTHPTFSKEIQAAQYDIGAAMSKHFQFDYSDLTTFERKFAKTVFPFYTFYRKNFVLQMQLLAQSPRGLRSAQAVMNYLNENGDVSDPMRELLPEYFDQLSAFQVPVPQGVRKKIGLPLDQPLYINPKLPFTSLNLMPDLWDVFRDTGQPTSQKVLGAFAPILGSWGPLSPAPIGIPGMKIMLEATVGETLGLNKTLDYQRSQSNDWRNSWVPAPSWVQYMPKPLRDFMGVFPWMSTVKGKKPGSGYLMTATGQYIMNQMATPFVTNLGQVIPAGGPGYDEGKSKADLVSWLTGIRLIPVDTLRMHRSWAYRLESMLEGRRADLKDQGLDLEPQDMESLRIVRQQIKTLEAAWDTRQNELYGPTP